MKRVLLFGFFQTEKNNLIFGLIRMHVRGKNNENATGILVVAAVINLKFPNLYVLYMYIS